ncbi:MAG: DUF6599 family protein, partial [Terriglobales bacterium]
MRVASLKSVLLALLLLSLPAIAQVRLITPVKEAPNTPKDAPILPLAFSGWQKAPGSPKGTNAAKPDPALTALLKETGNTAYERATYSRQGRNLEVKAFRFADATGALAAYSAMQNGPLAAEKFCPYAGSSGNRALMACTDLVVDVTFDKVTPMTPAEMRSLASLLPIATGHAALPANVPRYLPPDGLSAVAIALGPVGLASIPTDIPADAIDFSKGAEVAVGTYAEGDGEPARMTVVKYPTPAIAAERLSHIKQVKVIAVPDAPPLAIVTKRLGPMVISVIGYIPEPAARALAEQVPYDVEITPNEPVYNPKDNIGNLVVN